MLLLRAALLLVQSGSGMLQIGFSSLMCLQMKKQGMISSECYTAMRHHITSAMIITDSTRAVPDGISCNSLQHSHDHNQYSSILQATPSFVCQFAAYVSHQKR